jgi:hypothetical protein
VNPGNTASFSVTATGTNTPLTFQWGYTIDGSGWYPFSSPSVVSTQVDSTTYQSTYTTPVVGTAPFVTGLKVVALVTDSLGNGVRNATPAILTVNSHHFRTAAKFNRNCERHEHRKL